MNKSEKSTKHVPDPFTTENGSVIRRPGNGIFGFLGKILGTIGQIQLALTMPRWVESWAGLFYVLWFCLLTTIPVIGSFEPELKLAWAVASYILTLGLLVCHFRRDAEKDAARHGLLVGKGQFVKATYQGSPDDPQLRLESPFDKRLGTLTLLGCGVGMALSFSLFCQGMFQMGFEGWYRTAGTEPPYWEWVMYSGLSVFRALDLFDTLQTFEIEPSIVRHQGWAAASVVFGFKALLDVLLLAKLRSVLGEWFLFRRVVNATYLTPPGNRDQVRRNLSSALLATGELWIRIYAWLFLDWSNHPQQIREFARQILEGAGKYAHAVLGKRALSQLPASEGAEGWEELGKLELLPHDLPGHRVCGRVPVIPAPELGAEWAGNSLGMKFMGIKGGTFRMGESLEHQVKLTRGFWLGKYPVTMDEFERATGYNPGFFQEHSQVEYEPGYWIGEHPVTMEMFELMTGSKVPQPKETPARAPIQFVNWYEAQAFCLVLTLRERELGFLPPNWEYRLPTEAEWECAARAGSESAYCFGDDSTLLGDYAWSDRNCRQSPRTHEVGLKKPNAWGLHDMHGNVWEWCSDWYTDYLENLAVDPAGPSLGTSRVLRGGSWESSSAYDCTSARRQKYSPTLRMRSIGFRVAISYTLPSR